MRPCGMERRRLITGLRFLLTLTIAVYKVGLGGHLNCIPSKHGLVRGNERLSDLRGHCVSRESGWRNEKKKTYTTLFFVISGSKPEILKAASSGEHLSNPPYFCTKFLYICASCQAAITNMSRHCTNNDINGCSIENKGSKTNIFPLQKH